MHVAQRRGFVSVFLVTFFSHTMLLDASSAIHSLFRGMTPFQALTVFLLSRKDIMKGCIVVELGAGVAVECGVSQIAIVILTHSFHESGVGLAGFALASAAECGHMSPSLPSPPSPPLPSSPYVKRVFLCVSLFTNQVNSANCLCFCVLILQ